MYGATERVAWTQGREKSESRKQRAEIPEREQKQNKGSEAGRQELDEKQEGRCGRPDTPKHCLTISFFERLGDLVDKLCRFFLTEVTANHCGAPRNLGPDCRSGIELATDDDRQTLANTFSSYFCKSLLARVCECNLNLRRAK